MLTIIVIASILIFPPCFVIAFITNVLMVSISFYFVSPFVNNSVDFAT